MGFFSRYLGHPLVVLVISLGAAVGLLGYSGTGPTDQVMADDYPIAMAMRGELPPVALVQTSNRVATTKLIDAAAQLGEVHSDGTTTTLVEPASPMEDPEPPPPKKIVPTASIHRVAPGENLYTIADKYNVDVNTILGANELDDINRLNVGQELRILSDRGVLHTTRSGENLWEISRKYKVSIDDIIAANGIEQPSRLMPGQELFVPGGTPVKDLNYYRSQAGPEFIWPVKGRISSRYGPRWGRVHHGIDIAVITGTRVKAAADGRVTFAGYSASYGYLIIIDHGKNYETRYAHNSKLLVKTGQRVTQGTTIALSGNTGRSTGPHLHFEIRVKGATKDPLSYLP